MNYVDFRDMLVAAKHNVIAVRTFAKNAQGTPMLSFMYKYVRLVFCRVVRVHGLVGGWVRGWVGRLVGG